MSEPDAALASILNTSKYHREHEKFYAQSPLKLALDLHDASRMLKTLADHWAHLTPGAASAGNPYRGCEDLNETAGIQHTGLLFMETEGEPAEIVQLKRHLEVLRIDLEGAGAWLTRAMESSWDAAMPLLLNSKLAPVLGERHRIIVNDAHAAHLYTLVSRQIQRALDLLAVLDLSTASVRKDLAGPRSYPGYLYSASELLDHAIDGLTEAAGLVHDNERRWRVFREAVEGQTAFRGT